jgi:hypothetical protein
MDPQKWLTYVIKNINDNKTSQLKELLPQFINKNLLVKYAVNGVDTFVLSG